MTQFPDLLKFQLLFSEHTSDCLIYIALEMQFIQNVVPGKSQAILFE